VLFVKETVSLLRNSELRLISYYQLVTLKGDISDFISKRLQKFVMCADFEQPVRTFL